MSDTWDQFAPAPEAAPAAKPASGWDSFAPAEPSAQQRAVVEANGVPEEAARALTISKQTKVPPSVVQSDLPGYTAHANQQAAIKATANPALASYVQGNPMAARVSADDWDAMEEVSQTLQALHPDWIARKSSGGVLQGIPEVAGMLGTAPGREKLYSALKELPGAIGHGLLDFFQTPGKVASGEVNLTTPEGLDQGISFGIGVALGGRDIRVGRTADVPAGGTDSPADIDAFLAKVRGAKTRQEIDEFLKSKQPGPPGAMLQIEHAKAGAEALDAAMEVAQDSKTKARSPELFAEAAQAHDPGNVHIDAAKLMELYQAEGKVPAEGDGLFGFVPGLAEKLQTAHAIGGEVSIPVAQYISHVDPAVHEGLKDSVRLHDDGVTQVEAKEAEKAIEAWHGTPHDFERFDLAKIGTGEGAQVYGHGLYFAENKQVGEQYSKSVAERNLIGVEGAEPAADASIIAKKLAGDDVEIRYPVQLALHRMKMEGLTIDEASKLIHEEYSHFPPEKLQKAEDILRAAKPRILNEGQLYKVSINADPTHFLDWDKPFGEQSAKIQEAVKALQAQHDLPFHPDLNKDVVTGEQIYGHLKDVLATHKKSVPDANGFYKMDDGREAASKALAEAGIPGIKYLDQGSRVPYKYWLNDDEATYSVGRADGGRKAEAGPFKKLTEAQAAIRKLEKEGTRNFVVFDDKLVSIKEKNGSPIEALVEAAAETEKLSLGLDTRVFMNMLFKDAKSVGITDTEFKAYSDKIARAEQAVLDKAVKVHKAEVARALTPEWKRNEAKVQEEVTTELREQGPFATERYLRENKIELGGDNIDQIADDLAPLFGFESGDALRRGLTALETEQAASGKGPAVQLREAIKAETAARMEARYGNLAENIAKEAREVALADHTFDVLADEVRILAKAAGTTSPLTRAEMVEWAKGRFEATNIADAANWEKMRRAVERGGREAEKALLKSDFQEAFQAKQRQMLAAVLAKESLGLQGLVDRTEVKIDKFLSEETIKGLDQAHLEQIRQMLASVGLPQRFAPVAGTPVLRDFVTQSEGQIAVAPWLMDGSQPKLQDMTVEQFRAFADSMKSLEHVGRQATKLENARGQADLQNVVFDVVKSMGRFPFIDQPNRPTAMERTRGVGRKVIGAHLLVERVLDYTDKFDPHGPLTEWVDRPLRDANTKELVLTEQVTKMLRDLKGLTTEETNKPIENNLIRDANDKSGFLRMTHHELRTLMLNAGNWSNWRKLSEGFGVNEADLRRFVDQHATANDVAFVNGIWKVFDHLKPEADAVQLRDTGVPVDSIPAVGWDIAKGKLNGGYYPLSYDKYNSDIQGHLAQPLFDRGYFAATTPHGYTQERTAYKGAIDLTGTMLASKIQGMVHDIAFREAVRNANKLLENQEFRTAVSQYWGKEVADLLPGWIRDIANSHNLDDNYAQGFVRAAALIRQNVVSTLIAYNPGTFIKHGFTAAVMSADRVGFGKLLSATGEIGLSGAARNIADLISRDQRAPDEAFMQSFRDLLDQGQRGENARQFVLDSSAVMRNRQRQYEDSIRGAVDAITKIGVAKTLADFRQRQMQYGRLAVAFSDQMSAMPTWLAAYQRAYGSGESHADAVFQADKEMSRAHGSSFVGDQPAVTRIKNGPTGELARWFVPLYKFWNHQVNNNFQLAWDASASLGGNPGGEPGANAASISRRVGMVMAIIAIEELAGAAKDEDHKGILGHVLSASLRYFGGGFVGAREITNGLAGGYEPSTGMIGTLFKGGSDVVKDLSKATGVKAGLAKDWIIHTATAIGYATGVGGTQVGKTGQFAKDVITGRERPRTFNEYRQGLRTGHSKARIR